MAALALMLRREQTGYVVLLLEMRNIIFSLE
jgi:hypothetical protein